MKLMEHIILLLFVRPSVCPFVMLFCACHVLRTLHARVLKFYLWVPHEKIADPYFFSCPAYLFKSYFPFDKITLKSRIFVLLLPSWASSIGVKQC